MRRGCFTVIERRKSPSIDVEVRVDLDRGDFEPHSLEQQPGGRGDDTLADARDNASRDEDVLFVPLEHDEAPRESRTGGEERCEDMYGVQQPFQERERATAAGCRMPFKVAFCQSRPVTLFVCTRASPLPWTCGVEGPRC